MSNGIYTGGKRLQNRRKKQMNALVELIEEQKRKFSKGMGIRKLVGKVGDIFKTIVPGVGHAVDFGLEQIAGRNVDIGDPAEIAKQNRGWNIGLAQEASEDFRAIHAEVDPNKTFGADLLGQVGDFAGTEVGETLGTKIKDWGARTFGINKDQLAEKVTKQGLEDNPFLKSDDFWDLGSAETDHFSPDLHFSSDLIGGYPTKPYQEGGQVPTVSDYFSNKGKTLGGSNKHSLAEILGRK